MNSALPVASTRFELPERLSATRPPEMRGVRRDAVRLLVAGGAGIRHTRFDQIGTFLEPGDLLVVNTSRTMPAAVDARRATGTPVAVHFSTALDDGSWVVELRRPDGPALDAVAGERVALPGRRSLVLLESYPRPGARGSRLWRARVRTRGGVRRLLRSHGRPISYGYTAGRWPLSCYQTVFARQDGGMGSAEMPSAGRPFSAALVTELVSDGVGVAPLTLHTGVSSLEEGEPPLAEPFSVPVATAAQVNLTRESGHRVIAVGTTVARALETVADPDGTVTPRSGWTDLVLSPDRLARSVDGLVTGWHAPGASHLLLLRAVAGTVLVDAAYSAALREGYLWHEFGDSCLLLPRTRVSA